MCENIFPGQEIEWTNTYSGHSKGRIGATDEQTFIYLPYESMRIYSSSSILQQFTLRRP